MRTASIHFTYPGKARNDLIHALKGLETAIRHAPITLFNGAAPDSVSRAIFESSEQKMMLETMAVTSVVQQAMGVTTAPTIDALRDWLRDDETRLPKLFVELRPSAEALDLHATLLAETIALRQDVEKRGDCLKNLVDPSEVFNSVRLITKWSDYIGEVVIEDDHNDVFIGSLRYVSSGIRLQAAAIDDIILTASALSPKDKTKRIDGYADITVPVVSAIGVACAAAVGAVGYHFYGSRA